MARGFSEPFETGSEAQKRLTVVPAELRGSALQCIICMVELTGRQELVCAKDRCRKRLQRIKKRGLYTDDNINALVYNAVSEESVLEIRSEISEERRSVDWRHATYRGIDTGECVRDSLESSERKRIDRHNAQLRKMRLREAG